MANYNKVILVGNIVRDPENRTTQKGTAIAKITVAINRTWKSETGEEKEEATYVDVDAFGKQAETICKYLKKGSPVLIDGRLRTSTWEDKDTKQKRSKLTVTLESFQFLDSLKSRTTQDAAQPDAPPPTQTADEATPPF